MNSWVKGLSFQEKGMPDREHATEVHGHWAVMPEATISASGDGSRELRRAPGGGWKGALRVCPGSGRTVLRPRAPRALSAGASHELLDRREQGAVVEGEVQELELVHQADRLEDDQRPSPGGLARIVGRHHGHRPVLPHGHISHPRFVPEFPDDILRDHPLTIGLPVSRACIQV